MESTRNGGQAGTAVLVPVKAFHAAKARLADALSASDRAALARWMASGVLEAVRPLTTFVACDDDGVAEWADSLGAHVLWSPGLGLNGAVDHGVSTIAGKGFARVIISHGDLPLATGLTRLQPPIGAEASIVLVPDRHRDGTNVVVRPCAVELPATYGGGSFGRHLEAALATGCPVTVRFDARLSLDLDTLDDLEHPLVRARLHSVIGRWAR